MTALNKQAYHADGGDIGIGRLKEIADNAYGDEEKRWMAQRVLSLLDENLQLQRDKDSLEAVSIAMRDDMRDAREKLEAAEKRIAELETRAISIPEVRITVAESKRKNLTWRELGAYNEGADVAKEAILAVIRAAGIGVKGE